MDNRKALKDRELEKVNGGGIESANVVGYQNTDKPNKSDIQKEIDQSIVRINDNALI